MARATVAVIGGGAWGMALAATAARAGSPTLLHSRRALNGSVPKGVTQTHVQDGFKQIGAEARLILFAVPSGIAHTVLRSLGDHIDGRHLVVHGVRGLAGDSLERISDVVRRETPARRMGALGGPALAEDLAAGRPTVLVCGSHFPEVNSAVIDALASDTVRIYATEDLPGVEWASALVGCLAVGVGYAQGVGIGPGLMAAFITRSVSEAAKIAAAAGGDERTLLGLAGYGDLLACIAQNERPEVLVGTALAKGKSLSEAMLGTKQRVEAVELIPKVATWADAHGVSAPIFRALAGGVLASKPIDAIVKDLMTAPIEDRG